MMKNPIVIVVLLLLVGGGAFFGGMKYQESKQPTFSRQNRMSFGPNSENRANFRPVNGEIISQDDKSITVKLQDGSSKIVLLSNTTAINKSSEGLKADLKVGERVAVLGMENSGGSITAQNIQLNPPLK